MPVTSDKSVEGPIEKIVTLAPPRYRAYQFFKAQSAHPVWDFLLRSTISGEEVFNVPGFIRPLSDTDWVIIHTWPDMLVPKMYDSYIVETDYVFQHNYVNVNEFSRGQNQESLKCDTEGLCSHRNNILKTPLTLDESYQKHEHERLIETTRPKGSFSDQHDKIYDCNGPSNGDVVKCARIQRENSSTIISLQELADLEYPKDVNPRNGPGAISKSQRDRQRAMRSFGWALEMTRKGAKVSHTPSFDADEYIVLEGNLLLLYTNVRPQEYNPTQAQMLATSGWRVVE